MQNVLDRSAKNLSSLPESIRELTALEELNLDRNQLASLPEWLGELANLKALSLYSNRLTSLPDWVQRLEQRGCTVFV
jgi:Leucine-rich repeat (LRR) protein